MIQISIERILRANRPRNCQRGFTLMELPAVMSIMIILMLISIPDFIGMKAQADETSAIESHRAIYEAQIHYQIDFPANGFLLFARCARRRCQRRSTVRAGGTGSAWRSSHRPEVGLHL
jgi:type II secretory pathway pseudopilin PulG